MAYWVTAPAWLKLLYKNLIWKAPSTHENSVYLTFDDGPHPTITPFVLKQLEQYNAKATFFCIGKNVEAHLDIYQQIVSGGHTVGNHTHNHLNGWKTKTEDYLENVKQAATLIQSKLYRPPYGRIKKKQAEALINQQQYKIYMWDILSGDFDKNITSEQCLSNVLNNITSGSIIVFHDSEKAWDRMSYTLPKVLAYCHENNLSLKALPQE